MSGLSGRVLAAALAGGLIGSMGHALAGGASALMGNVPYYLVLDGRRSRGRGGSAGYAYTANYGNNAKKRKRRAAWKAQRLDAVQQAAARGTRAPKLKRYAS